MRPYCLVLHSNLLTDNFHPTRKLSLQRPSIPIGGIFVPVSYWAIWRMFHGWPIHLPYYCLSFKNPTVQSWYPVSTQKSLLGLPFQSLNGYTSSTPNCIPTSESHTHSSHLGWGKFKQHCSLSYCLVIGSEICLQASLTAARQVQCAGVTWLS